LFPVGLVDAFLAQKLTAINTISQICESQGGDISEVAKCVGADSRINDKFLKASIGFGGYCLEKDVKSLVYIARSLGLEEVADYWDRVVSFNRYQMIRFGEQIVRSLDNCLKNTKIVLMGAAFKANTNDCRNSCVFQILKVLLEENAGVIVVHDPFTKEDEFWSEYRFITGDKENNQRISFQGRITDSYFFAKLFKNANAVAFLTDHDAFKNNDEEFMNYIPKFSIIHDGRRILQRDIWRKQGYEIFTLGSNHANQLICQFTS